MKTARTTTFVPNCMLGCILVMAAVSSRVAMAQAQGGAGGGRNLAGGPGVAVLQARQILNQMDLTGDAKNKIDAMMGKFIKDMRDFRQSAQDLSPEDRRQKMQDLQKESADTMDQILQQLTPEQKTDFATRFAVATVNRVVKTLAVIRKSSASLDMTDDQKTEVNTLLDDTGKTMDGYKSDAASLKDYTAATELTANVNKSLADTRAQLVNILGRAESQQLMRNVLQSLGGERDNAPAARRATTSETPGADPSGNRASALTTRPDQRQD